MSDNIFIRVSVSVGDKTQFTDLTLTIDSNRLIEMVGEVFKKIGGGVELSPPTPSPRVCTPPSTPNIVNYRCTNCIIPISEDEQDYSFRIFKQALCRKCQDKLDPDFSIRRGSHGRSP